MTQSTSIQSVMPAGIPRPIMAYSPAVKVGDWLFVAGQMATDFVNGLPPEIANANPNVTSKLAAEAKQLIGTLAATVEEGGGDIARDVVRAWHWFVSDEPSQSSFDRDDNWMRRNVAPFHDAVGEAFGVPGPATTDMGIRELMIRDTSIEVDLICRLDGAQNQDVRLADAPGVPPAIRRGDYVFIPGQTGLDPDGGVEVRSSNRGTTVFELQAERALAKLAALAEAAGSRMSRAIKAEVYIGDPSHLSTLDQVWKRWFPSNPPARFVVPYMGLCRRGSLVEIALTLVTDGSPIVMKTIETSDAPEPIGHEPQAVVADDLIYFSTQMAFDSTGNLAAAATAHPNFPHYTRAPQLQMAYVLDNVSAIAEAGATSIDNLVRRACFHDNFDGFLPEYQEWTSRFSGVLPASTTVNLARGPLVVPGARFVLDLIGYVPAGE